MIGINTKYGFLPRHIAIWLFLFLYLFLTNSALGSFYARLIYITIFFLNILIAYYVLSFYLLKRINSNQLFLYLLAFVINYFLFIAIDYINVYKLINIFGGRSLRGTNEINKFIKNSTLFYLLVIIASLGTYIGRKRMEAFKQKLEQEKLLVENNLNILKDQFNSHLTLNFFSYCYSLVCRQNPNDAKYVEGFNEMLRYTLYNEHKKTVSISEEIEFINNFVEVQKCITSVVFVKKIVKGDVEKFNIIPMILAFFVENAFKHGIVNEEDKPIDVKIEVMNNSLIFSISNYVSTTHIGQQKSGYGIENIKKFLSNFYGDKQKLIITSTEIYYNVMLKIG